MLYYLKHPLTIFVKSYNIDVSQDPKCASRYCVLFTKSIITVDEKYCKCFLQFIRNEQ